MSFGCGRWAASWGERASGRAGRLKADGRARMGLQGFLLTPQVLWTGLPGPNLHLLVACAILDMERDTLMLSGFGSNEILKVRALPTFCSVRLQWVGLALGLIVDHCGWGWNCLFSPPTSLAV